MAWPGWTWRRGDSDIFGRHLKGYDTAGNLIELSERDGYYLEIVTKADNLANKLQQDILQLLKGMAVAIPR